MRVELLITHILLPLLTRNMISISSFVRSFDDECIKNTRVVLCLSSGGCIQILVSPSSGDETGGIDIHRNDAIRSSSHHADIRIARRSSRTVRRRRGVRVREGLRTGRDIVWTEPACHAFDRGRRRRHPGDKRRRCEFVVSELHTQG